MFKDQQPHTTTRVTASTSEVIRIMAITGMEIGIQTTVITGTMITVITGIGGTMITVITGTMITAVPPLTTTETTDQLEVICPSHGRRH